MSISRGVARSIADRWSPREVSSPHRERWPKDGNAAVRRVEIIARRRGGRRDDGLPRTRGRGPTRRSTRRAGGAARRRPVRQAWRSARARGPRASTSWPIPSRRARARRPPGRRGPRAVESVGDAVSRRGGATDFGASWTGEPFSAAVEVVDERAEASAGAEGPVTGRGSCTTAIPSGRAKGWPASRTRSLPADVAGRRPRRAPGGRVEAVAAGGEAGGAAGDGPVDIPYHAAGLRPRVSHEAQGAAPPGSMNGQGFETVYERTVDWTSSVKASAGPADARSRSKVRLHPMRSFKKSRSRGTCSIERSRRRSAPPRAYLMEE